MKEGNDHRLISRGLAGTDFQRRAGRIVFTLRGEVSDLGLILALNIFHSEGEGSAQGNAIHFGDACPHSMLWRRT